MKVKCRVNSDETVHMKFTSSLCVFDIHRTMHRDIFLY